MKTKALSVVLFVIGLPFVQAVQAGCSVHDHNCFHGAYALDPNLGVIPSGQATLDITTKYDNGAETDLNQHVGLPNNGTFNASGSDGEEVEATPLGGGDNVVYHDQQTVELVNPEGGVSMTANLNSEEGVETTEITNAVEGTYGIAIYNYDKEELGNDGTYTSKAKAGGRGHFSAPSQSHVATEFVYEKDLGGGTLAPDEASNAKTFEYYTAEHDPHAQGVSVLGDNGVSNISGTDLMNGSGHWNGVNMPVNSPYLGMGFTPHSNFDPSGAVGHDMYEYDAGLSFGFDFDGNMSIDVGPVSATATTVENPDGSKTHGGSFDIMGFGIQDTGNGLEAKSPFSVNDDGGLDYELGLKVGLSTPIASFDAKGGIKVEVVSPAADSATLGNGREPNAVEDAYGGYDVDGVNDADATDSNTGDFGYGGGDIGSGNPDADSEDNNGFW